MFIFFRVQDEVALTLSSKFTNKLENSVVVSLKVSRQKLLKIIEIMKTKKAKKINYPIAYLRCGEGVIVHYVCCPSRLKTTEGGGGSSRFSPDPLASLAVPPLSTTIQ